MRSRRVGSDSYRLRSNLLKLGAFETAGQGGLVGKDQTMNWVELNFSKINVNNV